MKKNIRKIPTAVLSKLNGITQKNIVVACAKAFRHKDLAAGLLSHLDITVSDQGISCPEMVLPPETQGKFSYRNINGEEVVRKDLPLETEYHTAEAPNWGDSSYGYHTVSLPHQQYPRDFRPPKGLQLLIKCVGQKECSEAYVIAFRVDEVLDKTSRGFKKILLENLNLLQENIGACGIEPADIPIEAYAKSLHVSWEILPPGSKDEVIARLFKGRIPKKHEIENVEERYDLFTSLKPKQIVIGTSGFSRYFGALLEENLIIFENVQYGNAIYILYENWKDLSQKTRLELLSGRFGRNFDRVVHKHGWKTQVRNIIKYRREKKGN
jgi:hypothetical protein